MRNVVLYCRLVVTTPYRLVLSTGRPIGKGSIRKFTVRANRSNCITTVISFMQWDV
jgi:hypothetical protein